MTEETTAADGSDEPEVVRELADLVERADAGDDDAIADLEKVLHNPAIWRHAAGLAAAAKAT